MEWFKEMFWSMGPIVIMIFVVPVIVIFVIRWLGASMLRITDVIQLQKEILKELKKINYKE